MLRSAPERVEGGYDVTIEDIDVSSDGKSATAYMRSYRTFDGERATNIGSPALMPLLMVDGRWYLRCG